MCERERERERESLLGTITCITPWNAQETRKYTRRERECVCARARVLACHTRKYTHAACARVHSHTHVQCMLDLFFSGSGYGSLSDSNAFFVWVGCTLDA